MAFGKVLTDPLPTRANILWNSAGSLVYLGCTWLLSVFVVRLSADYQAAGILALSMAVFNTFRPFAEYRMYDYQASDVGHENTAGEYFTFRLITSFGALIIAAIYALATCPSSSILAVLLYFIYKIVNTLVSVFHATMNLYSRMDYVGISSGIQGVSMLALFAIVFYATQSLEAAFVAMTAITVVIGVFYTYPRARAFEPIKLGISRQKTRHLLLTCLPIVIASVACSACPSIPRQYLALTQGESLLGAYASIAAPAAVIQMGASYLYTPLVSSFAQNYHNGNKAALASLLGKTVIGIAIIAIAAGAALALLGEWLLTLLFGTSIAAYIDFLTPVIIMTGVTAYLWFFNSVLISLRIFRPMVVGNALSAGITIALTIPLVDLLGANGVSVSVIAAYAVGIAAMILPTIAAIRKLGN